MSSVTPSWQVRARRTPLTSGVLVACAVVTAVWHSGGPLAVLAREWLVASSAELLQGRVWTLWTSALVHGDIIHLAFNGFWLWDLGGPLEIEFGRRGWIRFSLAAAAVASIAQILWGGSMGIGYSGVVYALAGLVYAAPEGRFPYCQSLVRRNWGLLVLWAVVCVGFEIAGTWGVANGAHLGGLAFGLAVGRALPWFEGGRSAA
ncbi:MAG: rhomboid family intramembrane serine protease [Deltaproteobacteria bacterium]|nr:MAG: rhomboid family intramembrane serine protease [Deltaproteobacteria bacterium]